MTRVTLSVEIDLDPTPGAMHTAADVCTRMQAHLDLLVGQYHPVVSVTHDGIRPPLADLAARATAEADSLIRRIHRYRELVTEHYGYVPALLDSRDAILVAGGRDKG